MSSFLRGVTAGAAGTTFLNAATYLDMAITSRPASSSPADTVAAALDAAGLETPSTDERTEALGALSGLGVGVGVGVVASLVRSAGVRLPLLAEAAVIGAGAMAAADGPMAVLEIADLSSWTAADWTRDVVPHLVYGVAVAGALRIGEKRADDVAEADEGPERPGRLLLRSLAIGMAAGSRASLGLVPPGVAGGTAPFVVSAGLVGAELVLDKLPSTPSRLGGPTLARVLTGAAGAAVLARRQGAAGIWPAAAAGAVGAVVGTIAGSTWRDFCAERSWEASGAIAEDVVSLALTSFAVRAVRA